MAYWIIPCNPRLYDVYGAFRSLQVIDWRQTVKRIEQGDTVYVYMGSPVKSVTHKCVVLETDIPMESVDFSDDPFDLVKDEDAASEQRHWKYMRLQMVKEFEPGDISFETLKRYGLKGSIQGQRRIDSPVIQMLSEY